MTAETTVPAPAQNESPSQEPTHAEESYCPMPVDIYEDNDGLVMLADFPGVEKGTLEVRLDRGTLTVMGQAHHIAPGQPIYREYELTGFYRQFKLPEEVDAERVEAELKNGVLRLKLPRAARAQPRRIEVRAA
jgi:HSP20 family molecular chaperone IbpA